MPTPDEKRQEQRDKNIKCASTALIFALIGWLIGGIHYGSLWVFVAVVPAAVAAFIGLVTAVVLLNA